MQSQATALSTGGVSSLHPEEFEKLVSKGMDVRKDLLECNKSGDYSRYGTVLEDQRTGAKILQLNRTPEQIENFRSLIAANKKEAGLDGVFVLLREPAAYEESKLLVSLGERPQATLAVTKDGTIVSAAKSPDRETRTPKGPEHRHRVDDLMMTGMHHEELGGYHLAARANGFLPGMYAAKYGFKPFGVVAMSPKESYGDAWTDEHEAEYKDVLAKNYVTKPDGTKVPMPLIIMELDTERHEKIMESDEKRLPKDAIEDFTSIDQLVKEGKLKFFEDSYAGYAEAVARRNNREARKVME